MQHKILQGEQYTWIAINKKKRKFGAQISNNKYLLLEIYKRKNGDNFVLREALIDLSDFTDRDMKEIIENYFYLNCDKFIEEYSQEYYIYYCLPLMVKEKDFYDIVTIHETVFPSFEKAYIAQKNYLQIKKDTV